MSESIPFDIVISFDVTGSMMPVLTTVRQNLSRLTSTIFEASSRTVRMMVFAHGDYDSTPYQTMHTSGFTSDPREVSRFINTVRHVSNSWNEGESYEVVLDECTRLDWNPDAKKLIILVGDDLPHPPHFPQNRKKLDWQASAQHLTEMDVCVFAVQCSSLNIERSKPFYKKLASFHRDSKYIQLEQFYMMSELVLGIFHSLSENPAELAHHEEQLAERGMMTRSMTRVFAVLRGEREEAEEEEEEMREAEEPDEEGRARNGAGAGGPREALASSSMVPVQQGRFQIMPVPGDCSIKEFVESMGIRFKTGRGFYELTKSEDLSPSKEIILEDVSTNEMFTGSEVSNVLGLDRSRKIRISKPHDPSRRIYIQSTSYNRKLLGGTMFLYEIVD